MTPKEKAQDLWVKYYERLPDSIYSNYAAKMDAKYVWLKYTKLQKLYKK